ncbi:unnamed protein product [Clavelina lepadiformis]|uniref:Uncharacterized protein n=1 Tax=Clavelina lepadiformis TaxID=159417 RepID=A0ABP0GGR7_CLALP
MDELVHDLTSALEESELKKEIHDSQLIFSRRRRIRKRRPLCGITQTQEKHINNSIAEDVSYKTDIPKSIELNLTGSDTESGFVLPVIRKHRRKKIKRMETETQICMPTKDRICLNKQVTVMELDYCNHPGMKSVKNRPEFESGISASDDSNEDAEGQDGDDEMTDFYNEPGGSVSGIPAIIPWWDDEKNDEDSKLKNIINNALPELSESAKRSKFHY